MPLPPHRAGTSLADRQGGKPCQVRLKPSSPDAAQSVILGQRLALVVADDHLALDSLRPDLGGDQRRCRRADDAGHLVAALDRIVRDRALGRPSSSQVFEVSEPRVRRDVVALGSPRPASRRSASSARNSSRLSCRRLVLREAHKAVEARQDRTEPAGRLRESRASSTSPRPAARRASATAQALGGLKIRRPVPASSHLLFDASSSTPGASAGTEGREPLAVFEQPGGRRPL